MSKIAATYKELRQKTESQISQEQLSYDVEDNKSQLESDLKATSRSLTQAKRELVTLKSEKTLSSQKIISQMDKIEGLEKGVKTLEALIKELF